MTVDDDDFSVVVGIKVFLTSFSLCVIFTILVSFWRDNALFASKAKINVV